MNYPSGTSQESAAVLSFGTGASLQIGLYHMLTVQGDIAPKLVWSVICLTTGRPAIIHFISQPLTTKPFT